MLIQEYKAEWIQNFKDIKLELDAALINLNYKIEHHHNGNQGIEDREVFKRGGIIKNPLLDEIKQHLYVYLFNSKALSRHILI